MSRNIMLRSINILKRVAACFLKNVISIEYPFMAFDHVQMHSDVFLKHVISIEYPFMALDQDHMRSEVFLKHVVPIE